MDKKYFSLKKYAFTLVELVFVTMIIALIMPEMFSLYNFIIKSNKEITARQQAIQQGYEFFERLNIFMEDYTIDYEEYFNRQMVGCSGQNFRGNNFKWNIGLSGYCTNFTAYGNENSTSNLTTNTEWSNLYYCSSIKDSTNNADDLKIFNKNSCANPAMICNGNRNNCKQSYGQYAVLFTDVKGGSGIIVGSEDDEALGDFFPNKVANKTIDAIEDSDNIQELYLISHNGDKRLYFRRKLDRVDDESGKYKQYKIQILRLRGFDAGRKHNFDDTSRDNKGIYDGVIDTWACDTSMGFVGSGDSIGGAYSGYYLPYSVDDCRVDLTHGTTDLFAWNISISPKGDPELYRANPNKQVNPYMRIMIINKIYFPSIFGNYMKIANSIKDFSVSLETTINMKDFYKTSY